MVVFFGLFLLLACLLDDQPDPAECPRKFPPSPSFPVGMVLVVLTHLFLESSAGVVVRLVSPVYVVLPVAPMTDVRCITAVFAIAHAVYRVSLRDAVYVLSGSVFWPSHGGACKCAMRQGSLRIRCGKRCGVLP